MEQKIPFHFFVQHLSSCVFIVAYLSFVLKETYIWMGLEQQLRTSVAEKNKLKKLLVEEN